MQPRQPADAAVHAHSPYARAAATLFFIAALGLLALSLRPFVLAMMRPAPQSSLGATYLVNLARTPTVDAGRLSYAILGLGQDADSGQQLVWVRSLKSNRVGGFAEGDKVFGGPMTVSEISGLVVELAYEDQVRRVELAP